MRANRSEEGLCRRLRVSCVSNVVKCLLTLVHVFTWDNSGIVPTSSNWTSASGTSSAGRLALSKPSTRRMKRTRSNAGRARCALRSGSSRSSRFCPNDGATGHNHGLLGPDASAKKILILRQHQTSYAAHTVKPIRETYNFKKMQDSERQRHTCPAYSSAKSISAIL